jgi:hypothetical protein
MPDPEEPAKNESPLCILGMRDQVDQHRKASER